MDAQKIIGKQQQNDWLLKPKEHASHLPNEAKPLIDILNSSRIKVLQEQYDRHNKKAIVSQATYLKQSKRRIYAATGSVIVGALILYLQSSETILGSVSSYKDIIIQALGVIELFFLGVTTFYISVLKNSKVYEDWMDERAHAETIRVKYFSEVSKAPEPDNVDLAKLQLEYFRRYMLGVQLNYYEGRGDQHRQHANKFMTRTGMLTTGAAIVAAIPASLHIADSSTGVITLLAFIGAVIAALTTMQSQLSMLGEDQRNARRYESIYYKLLDLAGELDEVRKAVDSGKRDVLQDFVERTNEVISLENQEWQTRRSRKPELST